MSDAPPSYFDAKFAWSRLPRRTPPYDEAMAREQASRCIQCPEPTCVAACPYGSRIHEWLALTAEGRFLEAAAVLYSTGVPAEICADTCPADKLCEEGCMINGRAEPVSIQAIGQFLHSYASSRGGTPPAR